MHMARAEMGPDVDHTDTSRLAERANGISFLEAAGVAKKP